MSNIHMVIMGCTLSLSLCAAQPHKSLGYTLTAQSSMKIQGSYEINGLAQQPVQTWLKRYGLQTLFTPQQVAILPNGDFVIRVPAKIAAQVLKAHYWRDFAIARLKDIKPLAIDGVFTGLVCGFGISIIEELIGLRSGSRAIPFLAMYTGAGYKLLTSQWHRQPLKQIATFENGDALICLHGLKEILDNIRNDTSLSLCKSENGIPQLTLPSEAKKPVTLHTALLHYLEGVNAAAAPQKPEGNHCATTA